MITLAATITIIAIVAAIVIGVGRALHAASRTIDTILVDELGPRVDERLAEQQLRERPRPGDDTQFSSWPSVRTHEA